MHENFVLNNNMCVRSNGDEENRRSARNITWGTPFRDLSSRPDLSERNDEVRKGGSHCASQSQMWL